MVRPESALSVTALLVVFALSACGAGPPPEPKTPAQPAPAASEPKSQPKPAPVAKPEPEPWPTFERPPGPPAPAAPDGSVANVDTVVGGMGGDLKRCYDRELQDNPASKGSFRLRVQIEPKGEVNSVALLSQSGTLSALLLRCCAKVVGSRWFASPGGSGATLELPLTLAPITSSRKEP